MCTDWKQIKKHFQQVQILTSHIGNLEYRAYPEKKLQDYYCGKKWRHVRDRDRDRERDCDRDRDRDRDHDRNCVMRRNLTVCVLGSQFSNWKFET